MATKYKYDKDTDYAALMEQAARRGDNAAAAVYEQQRNAKIRGEGMAGQEQTSDYAQYLPIEDVPDYDDTHRREAEALLTGRGTADRREQIDRMLDAADSRDGVTKAQIAALLDMDDAAYDRADSKLQQQARDAAAAKAAADKKAKAAQTAAEKEKAARDKAQTAARSDARRQIALILRNGGTVPGDLWQQSGYSAVTIAAMLRGRKG